MTGTKRWLEWVTLAGVGSDPLFERVSEETAIKMQKKAALASGHTYASDQEALYDFIAVNWAVYVNPPVLAEKF